MSFATWQHITDGNDELFIDGFTVTLNEIGSESESAGTRGNIVVNGWSLGVVVEVIALCEITPGGIIEGIDQAPLFMILDEGTMGADYGLPKAGSGDRGGWCYCCKTERKVIGCKTIDPKNVQAVCVRIRTSEKPVNNIIGPGAPFPQYVPEARTISVTLHTASTSETAVQLTNS